MRAGVFLGFLVMLGLVLPLARCGQIGPSPVDAASDADASPKPCSGLLASECPAGYSCFFPISEGCAAKGHCLPGKAGTCQQYRCTCNWSAPMGCGPPGYVVSPVAYLDGDVCGQEGCGLACELCDVSGYSPCTMSTPIAVTNACTPTQMTDAVAACLDANATQQTCDAWRTANAPDAGGGSCAACLFTLRSASAWGALVCDATGCSLNTAGCVDLVLGQQSQEKVVNGSGSCGDMLNAEYGCEDYACSTCSKIGAAGLTDYDFCEQSARANECHSYSAPIGSSNGPCAVFDADAGDADAAPLAASACFPQSEADLPAMLNVFCGTVP